MRLRRWEVATGSVVAAFMMSLVFLTLPPQAKGSEHFSPPVDDPCRYLRAADARRVIGADARRVSKHDDVNTCRYTTSTGAELVVQGWVFEDGRDPPKTSDVDRRVVLVGVRCWEPGAEIPVPPWESGRVIECFPGGYQFRVIASGDNLATADAAMRLVLRRAKRIDRQARGNTWDLLARGPGQRNANR